MTKPFHTHHLVENIRHILAEKARFAREPDPRYYVKAHALAEQEIHS